MKKLLPLFIGLMLAGIATKAQDPFFIQTYANPLYLNPAFAGTDTVQRIGANFRDEWPAIPGEFITYSISYDRNIIDSNLSIGILAYQDKAGQAVLTTTKATLVIGYQVHIKSFTLSAAVQGGSSQLNIDESKLNFGNMIDPRKGFIYNTGEVLTRNNVLVPDFSAGILGYGKYYFAGFSIDHFNQPNESFVAGTSPLPIKLTINAGGMIPLGKLILSPTLLYTQQQNFNQLVAELYLISKYVTTGLGFRNGDALLFDLGCQYKRVRFGFSYDLTISQLTLATGGSYEVSLALVLPYKSTKYKKTKGISYPHF